MRGLLQSLAAFGWLVFACGAAAESWKLVHAEGDDGLVANALSEFAARVSQETAGGLTLELTAVSSAEDAQRALGTGEVAAAVVPLAELSVGDALLGLDEVPFLATNFVDAAKLWRVLRPELERSLARRGLVPLFAVPEPPRGMLGNRPLAGLGDFHQLRVVLDARGLDGFARLTGARAVTGSSSGEALGSGRADIAFVSASDAVRQAAWSYADYYYDAPAWYPKQVVVAKRDALTALDREVRDALLSASDRAGEQAWRAAERSHAERVQNLRDRGIKVRDPDVKFLIALEALGRELLFLWSDSAGEAGALLVESYYAVK